MLYASCLVRDLLYLWIASKWNVFAQIVNIRREWNLSRVATSASWNSTVGYLTESSMDRISVPWFSVNFNLSLFFLSFFLLFLPFNTDGSAFHCSESCCSVISCWRFAYDRSGDDIKLIPVCSADNCAVRASWSSISPQFVKDNSQRVCDVLCLLRRTLGCLETIPCYPTATAMLLNKGPNNQEPYLAQALARLSFIR